MTEPVCTDKLPFATEDEANGAAVAAQHKYGGSKPKVYQCQDCSKWHLSTNFDEKD
jgi:hypothetical protein